MTKTIIKEVVFYPIRPTAKGLIGFASLLFDNKLALNSIGVYTRPDGSAFRLLFPSTKLANSKEINTYFPVNAETYNLIKEAIVKKIEELTEKVKGAEENE